MSICLPPISNFHPFLIKGEFFRVFCLRFTQQKHPQGRSARKPWPWAVVNLSKQPNQLLLSRLALDLRRAVWSSLVIHQIAVQRAAVDEMVLFLKYLVMIKSHYNIEYNYLQLCTYHGWESIPPSNRSAGRVLAYACESVSLVPALPVLSASAEVPESCQACPHLSPCRVGAQTSFHCTLINIIISIQNSMLAF